MLVAARDGALVLDRSNRYVTDRDGVLTQELVATQLVTGRIASGSPSFAQQHVLQSSGLNLGSPVASPADLVQVNDLQSVDLILGSPVASPVGLVQQHDLQPSGRTLGSPAVSPVGLGQQHSLQPSDLILGSPALSLVGLTQQHQIATSGISLFALSVQSPQMGQRHVLSLESPVFLPLDMAASKLQEINRLHPGGNVLFGPIRFTQLTLNPRQETPPQRMRSVRADPRGARVMRVRS